MRKKSETNYENQALALIEEYENRIMKGEKPNPSDYLARYSGPDKYNFIRELNTSTLLTMAGIIHREKQSETLTSEDIFKYFEGGEEGIRQRFRDLVVKRLEQVSVFEHPYLEQRAGFSQNGFRKLADGDLSIVTSLAIQSLADPLDYSIEDIMGSIVNLDDTARKCLTEEMRKDKFIRVAATGSESSGPDGLRVFMIIKALRELEIIPKAPNASQKPK